VHPILEGSLACPCRDSLSYMLWTRGAYQQRPGVCLSLPFSLCHTLASIFCDTSPEACAYLTKTSQQGCSQLHTSPLRSDDKTKQNKSHRRLACYASLTRYYASRRPAVLISPTEWVLVLALAVSSFDPYVLQSDAELVLGVHDLFARYRHPDSDRTTCTSFGRHSHPCAHDG